MATPATVWGARCKGWWLANTTGTPVSQWTAETGAPNLTQATGTKQPSTTLTPAGIKAITLSMVSPSDSLVGTLTGTGTSCQVACAFDTTGIVSALQGAALFWIYKGAGLTSAVQMSLEHDGTGPLLRVQGPSTRSGDLVSPRLTGGYHRAIVDVTTTGNATLYIDGIAVSTATTWGNLSTADTIEIGDGQATYNNSAAPNICSPCYAIDTANFTAGDVSGIDAVLLAYVAAAAPGGSAGKRRRRSTFGSRRR